MDTGAIEQVFEPTIERTSTMMTGNIVIKPIAQSIAIDKFYVDLDDITATKKDDKEENEEPGDEEKEITDINNEPAPEDDETKPKPHDDPEPNLEQTTPIVIDYKICVDTK